MFLVLSAAVNLSSQDSAQSRVIVPESSEIPPWYPDMGPAQAPPRDGRPVTALRWPVGKRPNVDSPLLVSSWAAADALHIWLFLDKAYPFPLQVLLTGSPGGYFSTTVSLSKAGWQLIEIPVNNFRPSHNPILSQCQRFGFRVQAGEVSANAVWWIGEVSVHPKSGAPFAALQYKGKPAEQLDLWDRTAKRGNPLEQALVLKYAAPVPAFAPPTAVKSALQYRSISQGAIPVAYLACDPASPYRGRQDLIDYTLKATDWLVGAESPNGTWWEPGQLAGDPNFNRFTLGAVLELARWCRMVPQGLVAWPRWKDRLQKAVEFQHKASRSEISWDYKDLGGGHYINQDVYIVLIDQLASELFSDPKEAEAARAAVQKIRGALLPDGALNYIGTENEAPTYHALDVLILARYLTLSGDPNARSLIEATRSYWPLTMSADGWAESWSEPWWKQYWEPIPPASLVIVTGVTHDPANAFLMNALLARRAFDQVDVDTVYALPYWTVVPNPRAPPTSYLLKDDNIRGFHGRKDNLYFGLTQGRGFRDTFVGGMITDPTKRVSLVAAFRGAEIEVWEDSPPKRHLSVSQQNDLTAIAQNGDSAALGAQYTLEPAAISQWPPPPPPPPTPWKTTQIWSVSPDGVLGSVTVEVTQPASADTIFGRIPLGPCKVQPDGTCGPLQVRFYETIAPPQVAVVKRFTPRASGEEWEGLVMTLSLHRIVRPGEKFEYLVWVGPREASAPQHVQRTPTGWTAQWSDGSTETTSFDPSNKRIGLTRGSNPQSN
jgi:hypothetical protein